MGWQQDHIHIKCKDYEQTVAFFKTHFGAREINRVRDLTFPIVTLELAGVLYNFSPPRQGEMVDPNTEPPRYGVYHIALRTEDLADVMASLKRATVKVLQGVTVMPSGVKVSFVESPDGMAIELLERK